MKSKFSFWAYFVSSYAFVFTVILLFSITADVLWNNILPAYFYIVVTIGVIFVWCWLVLGELRKKVVAVEIGYDHFIIKRYLGFGPSETIYFDQVAGYKISYLYSRANTYEFLYLMMGDEKTVKLSEYYHRNYVGLKEGIITAKINDLGVEDYSYPREIREIFI